MVLADTGVLYGAADRDDPRHGDCAGVLDDHADELLVPVPVMVETAWLIEARLGPAQEATLLRSVTSGELERVDLTDADWALFQALAVDGRTTYPRLAAVTGWSESTVRRRLARVKISSRCAQTIPTVMASNVSVASSPY